ncbi:caspase family protein [Arthrobacter bambusae]|uniref:caspase family protein n=1 Tax=Arthrobacter bambusae TaxID=1338426 RepID=UPI001F51335C|nr:caspase family protein [Arthrobacter bambusae]MCI0142091.1 caspase family protein [Arthrobacter bambusae]
MTTVELTPGEPGQPRTHALVVGVGAYRHLRKGAQPKRNDPLFSLGQLTSPTISARHFTDWLLKDFHNSSAELGTVELLLSEPRPSLAEHDSGPSSEVEYLSPDGTRSWPIEPATIDNLEDAFWRWRDRCHEHPGNVAIFYYCGHGVLLEDANVLLAEDYGAKRPRFDGAFNFSAMRRGMEESCSAGLQMFFIDACSTRPPDPPKLLTSGARIFDDDQTTTLTSPGGLALHAAANGNSAYGTIGQVSRFTEALVRCLKGLASQRRSGQWVIRIDHLQESINDVMDFLPKIDGGNRQESMLLWSKGKGILLESDRPPLVPVVVRLVPDSAALEANLALIASTDPALVWQFSGGPDSTLNGDGWWIDGVPAGKYDLRADFPKGRFRAQTVEVVITPPGPDPDPHPLSCEEV